MNTVEPPNKGHIGTRSFVLYREVSFIPRLKCTGIIGIGTSRFVLYREVVFIRSVLIGGSTVMPYNLSENGFCTFSPSPLSSKSRLLTVLSPGKDQMPNSFRDKLLDLERSEN